MHPEIGRIQMSQKLGKTAAELESMIMAELREYPECERVTGPPGAGWDAELAATSATINVDCEEKLAAIINRLRQQFDLAE
jgi:hypothetical protein